MAEVYKYQGGEYTFSKRLSDFWYYHKYKIISIICVAIILSVSLYSCINEEKYDCNFTFSIGNLKIPTDLNNALRKELTKHCKDYDGNGVTSINISNRSFTYDIENIPNYTNSDQKVNLENTLSTYATQFADPKNMLFVISEPVLMEFQSQVDYEVVQDKLLLNGTPVEKLFIQYSGQHFEENIYLICRNISGQIANKKNVKTYNAQATEVFENIKNAYTESGTGTK